MHQQHGQPLVAKWDSCKICEELDVDKCGNLTLEEIMDGFENPDCLHDRMRALSFYEENLEVFQRFGMRTDPEG